jgi:hypothetical protein
VFKEENFEKRFDLFFEKLQENRKIVILS